MILITGANGQLGQDFQKLFDNEKIEYIASDYKEGNGSAALDITNIETVKTFISDKKIGMIINCAAYNNVDGAESDRDGAFSLNCMAPENLALICKEKDIPFVTYSTDFVFSGLDEKVYSESDKAEPISVYGESKKAGEEAVLEISGKTFVIRTAWVFGVGNDNFIKKVIRWSGANNMLKVVDDEVSSPTYSWDLAVYSWKLIKTGKYGLFHLTNNGTASRNEFAKYILDKINWKGILNSAKQSDFNLPAKRPKCSKLSTEKIEDTIGEKIPHWKNAVDRFMEELK